MAQVIEPIDVNVPVDVAYRQWTQFESFPEYLSMVDSVVQSNETSNHWVVTIGGNQREFDTVIVEQIPNDRIAWTSTGGEVDHAGAVTFHHLSDAESRVLVQIEWEPEGFVESAGAALNIPDKAVKSELENFKRFIEEKARSTL
jgi:uncharacterized membrane protein